MSKLEEEKTETINLRGKVRSMKDFCTIIQGLVNRTEIDWLEWKEGIIRHKPCPGVPPSGNGPIKNLTKHLLSLEESWLKEELGRYLIRLTVKAPGEAELVIWLPNLREP